MSLGVVHSHGPQARKCPTVGCERGRTVICHLTFLDEGGRRKAVSACEKHVAFYVARAVTASVRRRHGDEGVRRHVDDLPLG